MTINEAREDDFKKLLQELRYKYFGDEVHWRQYLNRWAQEGIGLKKDLLATTRKLYDTANENCIYIRKQIEAGKVFNQYGQENVRYDSLAASDLKYYETEMDKLNEFKRLLPLVKPLVQIKKCDDQAYPQNCPQGYRGKDEQ